MFTLGGPEASCEAKQEVDASVCVVHLTVD